MSGDSSILTPAEMARAAEHAAFGKATTHQLKSFLLALTAGGYIALGFVFFVTSQVGAEQLPYGVARALGFIGALTIVELIYLGRSWEQADGGWGPWSWTSH